MSEHHPNPMQNATTWQSALLESFKKLNPKQQIKNPVLFLVYLGSIAVSIFWILSIFGLYQESAFFTGSIAVWLWFTVLFANFAESLAQGRAKAQAMALRSLKKTTMAVRLDPKTPIDELDENSIGQHVASTDLLVGDRILVKAGELIACDGEVIRGIASVNESAITGESAPVIREAGGDKSSVTGGTTVLSDWIIVKVTAQSGQGFIEHMIQMVETAQRRKTPNEIALNILLLTLTLIFVLVCATLYPFSDYSVSANSAGTIVSVTALLALLVCLIPTTIGGLLSAIGVAGMSRLLSANVIARSGRAVEAAGDIDVLLLDKTGTITYGNRHASAFYPAPGVAMDTLLNAALLSSFADETPEGRSIVQLAQKRLAHAPKSLPENAAFIPFSAQTRMSGITIGQTTIRKGAPQAVIEFIQNRGSTVDSSILRTSDEVASRGSTPLLVCQDDKILGMIELKDIVKPGIRERFAQLRRMGIKTVMITGDNPLTAATIAGEAGVDDFLAEATPETKLKCIRHYQNQGHMVAMTGDGTNDAPALAQADVAVAMNVGTQPAKEAANMVDLDSSPTKLIEIVQIGKQLLMTRGALTTFSIANDLAKFFAVLPAAFASTYPGLSVLNVMQLTSPISALLSAVIFNALIIIALIPLALKGVSYRPQSAGVLLQRNLLIYGLGGVIAPFVGIKLIDMLLTALNFV